MATLKEITIYAITFLLCLLTCLAILNYYAPSPSSRVFNNFILLSHTYLFRQHHNLILAPVIEGMNYYKLIYASILLTFICLYTSRKIIMNRLVSGTHNAESILKKTFVAAFVFILIFQMISLSKYFRREYEYFAGKSTDEKYTQLLGPIYFLPAYTKLRFPGYHKAIFVSDYNLNEDPDALDYRQMAHFLYPIDIRNIHKDEPPTLAIIAFKEKATAQIPEGYELVFSFKDLYVVAVKKGIRHP